MTPPRRARGFTLVEVLVAVALLSLIVGTIAGGFRLGKRAWETGRDYESVQEVEEAAGALAAILTRAFPIRVSEGQGAPVVGFEGRTDALRLVTTSDGGSDWGGLSIVEIRMSDGDLSVRTSVWRPNAWTAGGGGPSRTATALRRVTTFEISYFGAAEPDAAPAWTNAWTARGRAPSLVSVRLVASRNGRSIDASFSAAIRQAPS